jgi:hypothetical protein
MLGGNVLRHTDGLARLYGSAYLQAGSQVEHFDAQPLVRATAYDLYTTVAGVVAVGPCVAAYAALDGAADALAGRYYKVVATVQPGASGSAKFTTAQVITPPRLSVAIGVRQASRSGGAACPGAAGQEQCAQEE